MVILLVAFGLVAIFSIGAPFLLLGIALAALSAYRNRPVAFWPPLAGVVFLMVGYVLLAPLSCRGTELPGSVGTTDCFNLLGLDYSGTGSYSPPLWPALLGGAAIGLAGSAATWVVLRGRTRGPVTR